MLITHTVDVTELPAAERFDFWADLVAREAAPQRISSAHAGAFNGWAQITELGQLRLTSFRYPSLDTSRTSRLIRQSDPELYQLALPTSGRSAIAQQDRESALRPADFTLLDTSRPHEASHHPVASGSAAPELASSVTVLIPHALLPVPRDQVGRLLAARLPSGEGMGALLAGFLLQIARHPGQYQPSDAAFLGSTALSLIAATIAQQLDVERALPAQVQRDALRARVTAFVDAHLGDADLDPRTVAAAHHVSVRTLHRLFQDEQTSVAELIRARRLERCRQDLTNPLYRGTPIHAVAARWGLRDKAHFSRLFSATFGRSPQAYRDGT
ncbi:helix-turn-helix domain-containing protein [Dactylosporangium sp. NPDC049525]|uniref:AraC-like ligand-binding domain-containing protein n=1 Tax=Dactylosporangium sp. NPDC049525 TaxID=3154730 RepID=UPI003434CADB